MEKKIDSRYQELPRLPSTTKRLLELSSKYAELRQSHQTLKDAFEELLSAKYYQHPINMETNKNNWRTKAGLTDK